MNHIFTPEYPLDYIVVGEYSYMWQERDTITRPPTSCYFEYDIGLDSMHVGRMNISFSIKPNGELIEDEDLKGFVDYGPSVLFHADLHGFMELAKENGVKCKRKEAFRDLRWVPLDTAARIHPNGIGRYELVMARIRGKGQEKRSNGTYYFRFVDVAVLDPFTGEVLRKETLREARGRSLGTACGMSSL
ncbi:MAG: hypothetical protein ABI432_14740 [Flavobacteriales bacterium]